MIWALFKEPFITGLGLGFGIATVFIVTRIVADFARGLFGIDDEGDDGEKKE